MWTVLPYVSSGVTLFAFLAAVVALTYRHRMISKRDLIQSVPAEERFQLVKNMLEFFDVDTTRLTKQQQFEIVIQQVQNRAKRFLVSAVVVAFIAVLAATVTIVSLFAMSPELPNTTFEIHDSETGDSIKRNFVSTFDIGNGTTIKTEQGVNGVCRIAGLPSSNVRVRSISCEGYENALPKGGGDAIICDNGKVWLRRSEDFMLSILPSAPLVEQVPSNVEYQRVTRNERDPEKDRITLTCNNNTSGSIDLLLFHYTPGEIPESPFKWTHIIARRGFTPFAKFGQKPGYVLLFASRFGQAAKYLGHRHLYGTEANTIDFQEGEGGSLIHRFSVY